MITPSLKSGLIGIIWPCNGDVFKFEFTLTYGIKFSFLSYLYFLLMIRRTVKKILGQNIIIFLDFFPSS